ncbi:MAG: garR 4 [Mycobacterium sp.]|nr:garR 4 [Mycobacterium sp.]
MSNTGTVGFIGLGAMGSPMSRHLLEAGWRVVGYDVSADAMERHRGNGGDTVDHPSELRGAAEVVLTSLPSASALDAGLSALADGGTEPTRVIELSTLTLEQKEAARERAAAAGMRLLDCPVSGTSAQAEKGDLVAYLSGAEDQDHLLVDPVLADMTRQVYDLGAFGNGIRLKLVANLLVAVHNLSSAEALLLAQRSGLDLNAALPALLDGAGASKMLEVRGPLMLSGDYDNATARVEVFRKDLRAIQQLADGLDVPTPLLSVTAMIYAAAAGQGMSQQDTACVFPVLQKLAGTD